MGGEVGKGSLDANAKGLSARQLVVSTSEVIEMDTGDCTVLLKSRTSEAKKSPTSERSEVP
jgi:hypothetical protein